MCEPVKSTWLADTVAEAVSMATDAARWTARTTVRLTCRKAGDESLARARWVLCWRFLVEAVVAAAVVQRLGRGAMWVFLGAAAASGLVGYLVHLEIKRRRELAPASAAEVEPEPEIELGPDGRPHLEAVS